MVWMDDGQALLEVELVSAPKSVPSFLLEKRIVHGQCDSGGHPYGLGVITGTDFWTQTTIRGGGLSGTQMQCDATFIGRDAAFDRDY